MSKHSPSTKHSRDGKQLSGQPSQEQDTPGRPTPEGSRQQTQPNQGSQTGAPDIDSKAKGEPPASPDVRNEK